MKAFQLQIRGERKQSQSPSLDDFDNRVLRCYNKFLHNESKDTNLKANS